LFTTSQEVKDPLIFWGFAAAGLLNAVLAAQMLMFWKNDGPPGSVDFKRRNTEDGLYSPMKAESEPSSAKRWTGRKLD
jgi:mannose-P-dolichol utilization defect protein 1